MAVIYRFSTKYLISPKKWLTDKLAVGQKIGPHQVNTTLLHLARLLNNVEQNITSVSVKLLPVREGATAASLGTGALYSATRASDGSNIVGQFVAAQMKLHTHNNYSLVVKEELDGSGLYRLVLALDATTSRNSSVLATSDPLPKKQNFAAQMKANAPWVKG